MNRLFIKPDWNVSNNVKIIVTTKEFNKMKNFYFKDLSYPRNTIDDLKIILFDNGWKITKINFATHKNSNSMLKIAGGPKKLLKNAKKRFSNISLAELTSSRIIIQAEKD